MFQPTQQFSLITIGLSVTLVYFMWMDVALYINLQKMPVLPGPNNTANKQNEGASSFSPVYPVHVKQLMLGPISHYVYNSFGHWIVTYTNLASYLTADAVSAIGNSIMNHFSYVTVLKYNLLFKN